MDNILLFKIQYIYLKEKLTIQNYIIVFSLNIFIRQIRTTVVLNYDTEQTLTCINKILNNSEMYEYLTLAHISYFNQQYFLRVVFSKWNQIFTLISYGLPKYNEARLALTRTYLSQLFRKSTISIFSTNQ